MNKKEKIKAELESLIKNGTINPHDVVRFARNPKTALHSCFTWDDSEAAEKWRLHQARNLIRVIVNVIPSVDEETEYRAYVSLKQDRVNGTGYRPMVTVLSDDELRQVMLDEALEALTAIKEKYKTIKELAEVFEAVDRVKEKRKEIRPEFKRPRHVEARV